MIERNITEREMLASALHLQLLTGEPTLRMSADVVQMLYDQLTRENEPTFGGWISVTDQLPENQVTVLIVKQLKSGQRQIGLGYCIREYKHHDYVTGEDKIEPYWVCGGNNNVIYWMPLPEMPEQT